MSRKIPQKLFIEKTDNKKNYTIMNRIHGTCQNTLIFHQFGEGPYIYFRQITQSCRPALKYTRSIKYCMERHWNINQVKKLVKGLNISSRVSIIDPNQDDNAKMAFYLLRKKRWLRHFDITANTLFLSQNVYQMDLNGLAKILRGNINAKILIHVPSDDYAKIIGIFKALLLGLSSNSSGSITFDLDVRDDSAFPVLITVLTDITYLIESKRLPIILNLTANIMSIESFTILKPLLHLISQCTVSFQFADQCRVFRKGILGLPHKFNLGISDLFHFLENNYFTKSLRKLELKITAKCRIYLEPFFVFLHHNTKVSDLTIKFIEEEKINDNVYESIWEIIGKWLKILGPQITKLTIKAIGKNIPISVCSIFGSLRNLATLRISALNRDCTMIVLPILCRSFKKLIQLQSLKLKLYGGLLYASEVLILFDSFRRLYKLRALNLDMGLVGGIPSVILECMASDIARLYNLHKLKLLLSSGNLNSKIFDFVTCVLYSNKLLRVLDVCGHNRDELDDTVFEGFDERTCIILGYFDLEDDDND
jgi:hypothetical protein